MKTKMKLILFTLSFLLISEVVMSQITGQTVKGTVIDKQSQQPLSGVRIVILNSDPLISTVSDPNGN